MALSADILQHYEVLRSRFLTDEHESVFSHRELSVDILINQGLFGWSRVWDKCDRNSEPGSLASARATGSGPETRLSSEIAPEITSILVNMTFQHLRSATTTQKESNL